MFEAPSIFTIDVDMMVMDSEDMDSCDYAETVNICMNTPLSGCPAGVSLTPGCSCGVSKSYCRTHLT